MSSITPGWTRFIVRSPVSRSMSFILILDGPIPVWDCPPGMISRSVVIKSRPSMYMDSIALMVAVLYACPLNTRLSMETVPSAPPRRSSPDPDVGATTPPEADGDGEVTVTSVMSICFRSTFMKFLYAFVKSTSINMREPAEEPETLIIAPSPASPSVLQLVTSPRMR